MQRARGATAAAQAQVLLHPVRGCVPTRASSSTFPDHQQAEHAAGSAAQPSPIPAPSSRRDLLVTVAAVAAGAVTAASLVPVPAEAAAAAAPSCELTASSSGLQFCDLQVGEGPEPAKGALIRCHYSGSLVSNGRVFDSSYERGRPLTFKVGVHEVISGWDLGILGDGDAVPPMKEGGKRLLVIPSSLGYGARGAGGVIPPNADLQFTVELLGKRR